MTRREMLAKLASRKFLLALLGVILTFTAEALGMEIPWEAVSVIVAYIFGEAGVDAMRTIRQRQ